MTDIFKSKANEFYIDLKQERYFFPGENVSGDVVLLLDKQTKTNNIKVLLEGTVDLGGRAIKFLTKFVLIAQPPEGEKNYLLDPHTHRFPFTITIPTVEECNIPSTLEISKLVKVYYRLTAIFNRATFFNSEKLNASTSLDINVLENINVKSLQYSQDLKVEKELMLEGAHKPVKVSTTIGKRAAVKGDTIPVSIKIEHIGVMVRDRAISVQLLRSVYYGKNQTELFGPKEVQKVTSNIEISGPTSFTKTFRLSMPIPKDTCPTVDKSGQTFRIEYTIHVSVNLNEESPYRPESPKEFVLFNFPFVIGTCPRLTFNIDEDYEDEQEPAVEEETESIHSSEYDQVTETMKHLDLGVQEKPVEMVQQAEPVEAVQQEEPTTPLPQRYSPPRPRYEMPTVNTTTPEEYKPDSRSPIHEDQYKAPLIDALLDELETESEPLATATNSGGSTPQITKSSSSSPQLPYTFIPTSPFIPVSPAHVFNDYNPGVITASPSNSTTTTNTTSLGRKPSAHWVVRNQEIPVVAQPPPLRPSNSTDVRNSSPLPDFAGMPVPQPNYTHSTPTYPEQPQPQHYYTQQQSNYYNPNPHSLYPQPQHDYRPPQQPSYGMPSAVFQPTSYNIPSQQHGYPHPPPPPPPQYYGYPSYPNHHH